MATTDLGLLTILTVLLDHLGLGQRKEAGVRGIGHKLTGRARRIERIDGRSVHRGCRSRGHSRLGRQRGKRIVHAGKLIGLLGGELVDAIGSSGVKGVECVGGTAGGRKRLTHAGVERTRVVAGAGKVDSRAVGLNGIRRTAELNEATSKLAECGGRSRIGAVDGSLTEGSTRVGIVARLEQRVTQAQIGLERRGVGSILRSSRERLGGRRVVAHGGERLAAVGEQRTALAVGAVVEGGGIGLGGLGIHAQVHQGVTTKVIGLAHNLIGSLCRPKHLGCSGKITRAVSGAALLDQLAIQGSPLYS